jgi:hypothetical protein
MSFKEYLKESLWKMEKVNRGTFSQIFDVYKNPNEYEVNQISKSFFELNNINQKGLSKALRGIIDNNNGNIYIWNANLLHDIAIKQFKLNPNGFRLVLNPKNKSINVDEYNIKISDFPKDSLEKLEKTGYESIMWYIDDGSDKAEKMKYNFATRQITKITSEEDWD